MQINNFPQHSYNQSFGGIKTGKMTPHCKKILRERLLPKIDENIINELDNMGYDLAFKRDGAREFASYLYNKITKELHFVNHFDVFCKKNLNKNIKEFPEELRYVLNYITEPKK